MGQGKRKGNSVSPSRTAYNIHTFKFITSFAWSRINFLLPRCPAFVETEAAAWGEVEIGIELGVETATLRERSFQRRL